MSYPYRENLEVLDDSSNKMIRCSRCAQMLCRLGEDWKKTCTRRMFPPVRAGALMNDLVGHYLLEKLYCPSCGVLLDSNLLEVSNARATS
jgi:acetone carboxylase gamma subunit